MEATRTQPAVTEPTTDTVKEVRDGMKEAFLDPSVEQDNWKHRSAKMRCGTCMFFVIKPTSVIQERNLIGRCRALAPTMKGWPVVFSDDWCGNHKLDEEKI